MKPKKSLHKDSKVTGSLPEGVTWKELEKLLSGGHYKEQTQKLDDKTLSFLFTNRSIAIEYARMYIEKAEPEKLTEEYTNIVANGMQFMAKTVLEERSRMKASKTKKSS